MPLDSRNGMPMHISLVCKLYTRNDTQIEIEHLPFKADNEKVMH